LIKPKKTLNEKKTKLVSSDPYENFADAKEK
jgi:hypothetical protein